MLEINIDLKVKYYKGFEILNQKIPTKLLHYICMYTG